ncbi:MAG TPA: response regulator transcription factor [Phnomibacter sp.]|nr:response regulator transcription factor [Phnomibacter sp.]
MHRIQLFVVDDHYMVVEGIRILLQQEEDFEFIGSASNAASCLAFLRTHAPDVILMDINLPDIDGTELCKQVKTLYPGIFVLGLSTFNQQSLIAKMLENGASGYLLKNAGREELHEAIKQVLRGKTYLSFEAASAMRQKQATELPVLTRREKEVLQLIAEGSTNIEIAEKLYLSPSTVDTHRKNLLLKLQAKNTAALVKLAVENKLL